MENSCVVKSERQALVEALRANATENKALLMDSRTTRFVGTADELPDNEVIDAIRSVPTHYAG